LDVFALDYPEWEAKAKGHVRQFLDFCDVDWWQLFVKSVVRENLKITSARAVTFGGMERWLDKQVAVAMSVWFDVRGKEAIGAFKEMLRRARKRDRSRYSAVLQLAESEP